MTVPLPLVTWIAEARTGALFTLMVAFVPNVTMSLDWKASADCVRELDQFWLLVSVFQLLPPVPVQNRLPGPPVIRS